MSEKKPKAMDPQSIAEEDDRNLAPYSEIHDKTTAMIHEYSRALASNPQARASMIRRMMEHLLIEEDTNEPDSFIVLRESLEAAKSTVALIEQARPKRTRRDGQAQGEITVEPKMKTGAGEEEDELALSEIDANDAEDEDEDDADFVAPRGKGKGKAKTLGRPRKAPTKKSSPRKGTRKLAGMAPDAIMKEHMKQAWPNGLADVVGLLRTSKIFDILALAVTSLGWDLAALGLAETDLLDLIGKCLKQETAENLLSHVKTRAQLNAMQADQYQVMQYSASQNLPAEIRSVEEIDQQFEILDKDSEARSGAYDAFKSVLMNDCYFYIVVNEDNACRQLLASGSTPRVWLRSQLRRLGLTDDHHKLENKNMSWQIVIRFLRYYVREHTRKQLAIQKAKDRQIARQEGKRLTLAAQAESADKLEDDIEAQDPQIKPPVDTYRPFGDQLTVKRNRGLVVKEFLDWNEGFKGLIPSYKGTKRLQQIHATTIVKDLDSEDKTVIRHIHVLLNAIQEVADLQSYCNIINNVLVKPCLRKAEVDLDDIASLEKALHSEQWVHLGTDLSANDKEQRIPFRPKLQIEYPSKIDMVEQHDDHEEYEEHEEDEDDQVDEEEDPMETEDEEILDIN